VAEKKNQKSRKYKKGWKGQTSKLRHPGKFKKKEHTGMEGRVKTGSNQNQTGELPIGGGKGDRGLNQKQIEGAVGGRGGPKGPGANSQEAL